MATNMIALIREQARLVIDPLLIRFREELYGSGISYGKIQPSSLPPTVITTGGGGGTTDVNDLGYITGITTYSGGVLIGSNQTELEFQNIKAWSVGARTIIDAAHTHLHSAITDWNTAVANTPAVLLNTAKVTNAFHIGDVVGSGYLTIQPDAVTLDKIADSGAIEGQAIVYSGGEWVVGYTAASGIVGIHAATHASGGYDELLPSDIGAATQLDHLALAGELAAHELLKATTSDLGHVIVGSGLAIDGAGVLSIIGVDMIIDPTTTTGDLLYRGADGEIHRLGIGTEGEVLGVVDSLPAWILASGVGGGSGTISHYGNVVTYAGVTGTVDGVNDTFSLIEDAVASSVTIFILISGETYMQIIPGSNVEENAAYSRVNQDITPTSNSTPTIGFGSTGLVALADNDLGTACGFSIYADITIEFDLGTPKTVRRGRYVGMTVGGWSPPRYHHWDYSDNGTTWTYGTTLGSSSSTDGSVTLDELPDNGEHRYWRLYVVDNFINSGGYTTAMREVYLDELAPSTDTVVITPAPPDGSIIQANYQRYIE